MQRTALILVSAFLLTLAAGGVVGRIVTSVPKTPVAGPDGGWLAQQLQLTTDQRAAVQAVWDQTHQEMDLRMQRRRAVDDQFQQDVVNLLTPDQKTRYLDLRAHATEQARSINSDMQNVLNHSIEQTKQILTPQQTEKYNQLLERFPSNQPPESGPDHLAVPPGMIEPTGGYMP